MEASNRLQTFGTVLTALSILYYVSYSCGGEENDLGDCLMVEDDGDGDAEKDIVLAGENQGERQYAPLHWACQHREHAKMRQEEVSSKELYY